MSTALALSLAVVRCAATVLITPGSGQTPTRFDDVPSMDGFGPRIPDEASQPRQSSFSRSIELDYSVELVSQQILVKPNY